MLWITSGLVQAEKNTWLRLENIIFWFPDEVYHVPPQQWLGVALTVTDTCWTVIIGQQLLKTTTHSGG